MNTTSTNLRQTLRDFPCLLNCCTVNWFTHWPSDALQFVSRSFLRDIEFQPEELVGVIKVSEHFHTFATQRADESYTNDTSYNCVTPASFLELNSLFKTLLTKKRNEVNEIKQRFTVGLEKIKDAASQVGVMQGELEDIQPHLTAASQEVDKCVALVEKDQNEVSELEKIVKNEDGIVTEKNRQVTTILQECQDDLAEVTLAVETVLEELASIQQQDFAAVRGLRQPTPCIKLIMEALCMLKGVKPDKLPDGGPGGKMVDDYWGPSKRLLGEQRFAGDLALLEKDDINPKIMKLIREKYITNPELDPATSKQSIGAGDNVILALFKWLTAIEGYDKVAKIVAPKKESVLKIKHELEQATQSLTEKQAVFDEANQKLKVLQAELSTKKAKKADLENEVETCSRKLERAEQLIGGLGGERDKWAEIVGQLGTKYVRLTGDILLASAMVAYLGSAEQCQRDAILREWMKLCKENCVPFSEDFSLYNALGDEIVRQSWQLSGLPSHTFFTDNGIITFASKRWVLLLDPQETGKKWVQAVEKNNNLQVLKQSDVEFLRNLESSIQFGHPTLLENVGESLDPILEPLLTKQTFRQGGSVCLKLGDSTLEYHKDFKLYITTKLRNPKLGRDTVSKVSLVNFCITRLGLDEQLLTITVTRERPELEEERAQLIVQANDNRKQLRDIENKILEVLFTSKGNILEDENAIKVLSSSKVLANEITEKQNIALESKKKIDENRQPYLQVAAYVGVLFFTISDLSHVNHMYQFSLLWFINLFCNSIDLADKSEDLDERLGSIKEHMTQSLYQTVSRGIFDEDRHLFSFLLCANILKHRDHITEEDWSDFLSVLPITDPNANSISMDANDRQRLHDLCDRRPQMRQIYDSMEANQEAWLKFLNLPNSMENQLPGINCPDLASFERFMLMTCINKKDLIPNIGHFVNSSIGQSYTQYPLSDLHKAFLDSSCIMPIVFILGETADPCPDIYKLAEKLNIVGKRLQFICMGEGKERRAEELMKEGIQAGNWVIFQNCHMVPSWLAKLEFMCEGLDEDLASTDFRLWITTRETKNFPIPILQNCIKVVEEEPRTLKNSLLESFPPSSNQTMDNYEDLSAPMKRMTLSISFFHALINERTRFKWTGWNQAYVFSGRDKLLSLQYLASFFSSSKTSWLSSVSSFLCDCIIGSGVEDPTDSRTLAAIFNRFCSEEIVEADGANLDSEGVYSVAQFAEYSQLVKYVTGLPSAASPSILRVNTPTYNQRMCREAQALIHKLQLTQNIKIREALTFNISSFYWRGQLFKCPLMDILQIQGVN